MGQVELFMVAIGLSMDAFAVSLCKGLNMRKLNYKQALIIAVLFGGFQAAMPLLGWLLGRQFEHYITSFDHWIAFFLLAFIGGNMLVEAFKGRHDDSEYNEQLNIKELLMLAVATSIDALAVGITFAFLQVTILYAITIIGFTTFILSFAGVALGNKCGMKYESKAEILGGLVLIVIAVKILMEHLDIIS